MKISLSMSPIWMRYGLEEREIYRAWYDCGFRYMAYDFGAFGKAGDGRYQQADWRVQAHQARSFVRDAGLTPLLAHAPMDNPFASDNALRGVLEAIASAGEMDIGKIVVPLGIHPDNTRSAFMDSNILYLRRCLAVAETAGVTLLVENAGNWQEQHHIRHAIEMNPLLEEIGHPLLRVNLNVGNLCVADIQPYDQIRLLGTAIDAVDVSDNFGAMPLAIHPWRQDFKLPPLMGAMDFDEVMQGLLDIGYQGVFNLQLDSPRCFDKPNVCCPRPRLVHMPLENTMGYYQWIYRVAQYMLEAYGSFTA